MLYLTLTKLSPYNPLLNIVARSSRTSVLGGIIQRVVGYSNVRQHSLSERLERVRTIVKSNLSYSWEVLSTCIVRDEDYIQNLGYLAGLVAIARSNPKSRHKQMLTDEDIAALKGLEEMARLNGGHLDEFERTAMNSGDMDFFSAHEQIKVLFLPYNDSLFEPFLGKLQRLAAIDNLDGIVPLEESEKLSRKEVRFLAKILSIKTLLERIRTCCEKEYRTLNDKWKLVFELLESPFLQQLKASYVSCYPSGAVFLMRGELKPGYYNCLGVLPSLLIGKIHHIGIFVKAPELCLSHITSYSNSHVVRPPESPWALAYFDAFTLNIVPLLPEGLSVEQRDNLQYVFTDEFASLASVARSKLQTAGTLEQLKILFSGHEVSVATPLAEVDYPPDKSLMTCSSYVAVTFLKALQAVNEALVAMGHSGIEHPFGEREYLRNIDILRLLDFWNTLGLIAPVPLSASIEKVVNTTQLVWQK